MQRLILLSLFALASLVAAGCVRTARIDLAGESPSSLTTRLEGSFVLPDGSPAAGAEVTGCYGVQSLSTTADKHGRFHFKRWNIVGQPGEVRGQLTDAAGHVYFATLPFRAVGDAGGSCYVGEGVLQHTTALSGRLTYPEGIDGAAWCEITGGETKIEVTAEADGRFRVELWPSTAQPIQVRAFAGERPLVMAVGTAGPSSFAVDSIEFGLGEIHCRPPE